MIVKRVNNDYVTSVEDNKTELNNILALCLTNDYNARIVATNVQETINYIIDFYEENEIEMQSSNFLVRLNNNSIISVYSEQALLDENVLKNLDKPWSDIVIIDSIANVELEAMAALLNSLVERKR